MIAAGWPIILGAGLLGAGAASLPAAFLLRARIRQAREEAEDRIRRARETQVEERTRVEDALRRTLILFQLLQDVTAAAGLARSVEEALQDSLDIICAFSGWPVAHVFLAEEADGSLPQLKAAGIWHLENPHDFEAFLRSGEKRPLGLGRGLPGRAWSSRRAVWARYTEDPNSADFFLRALDVGLTMGYAIPVFKNEELLAVLEFFSPPAPDPGETMLDVLNGVGEQLSRMAERLQAQEELGKLNRRLVELNEEKNQFLAIASHDLKNPLNGIGLIGELLGSGSLSPEEAAEMGVRIAGEAQRTTALIQKLLDVTAIESGRFNLRIGPVSLGRALTLAREKHQGMAEAKGQALVLGEAPEDVFVSADVDYLQEVLDNLVTNALKFMAPGPPLRTATLGFGRLGSMGFIDIRDEGPGFSEEDLSRAFGRFTKLSARPTGGEASTGLGLSIVRKLVERMQGRVELDSQLGRGSRFRLSFPLAEP